MHHDSMVWIGSFDVRDTGKWGSGCFVFQWLHHLTQHPIAKSINELCRLEGIGRTPSRRDCRNSMSSILTRIFTFAHHIDPSTDSRECHPFGPTVRGFSIHRPFLCLDFIDERWSSSQTHHTHQGRTCLFSSHRVLVLVRLEQPKEVLWIANGVVWVSAKTGLRVCCVCNVAILFDGFSSSQMWP